VGRDVCRPQGRLITSDQYGKRIDCSASHRFRGQHPPEPLETGLGGAHDFFMPSTASMSW
jgi:hypothetical protein